MGNDAPYVADKLTALKISIHVPAWGTTTVGLWKLKLQQHFNPRSRVGNDTCRPIDGAIVGYFNPRSRAGNDGYLKTLPGFKKISIHVPAWGTTGQASYWMPWMLIFQSTFPRGERREQKTICSIMTQFQSTFPRGERLPRHVQPSHLSRFQSTFPRGERHRVRLQVFPSHQFQSTFPRGERPNLTIQVSFSARISIHVPAWGTTASKQDKDTRTDDISIHVPAWGTTQVADFLNKQIAISIHVPAWGTTEFGMALHRDIEISIHVPAWGTTLDKRYLVDSS